MSDSRETTAQPSAPTDFVSQADETSGRLSNGEKFSTGDQLLSNTKKTETLPPTEAYKELTLPESLHGQEENFASFKQLAAELNLPAEAARKLMQWEAAACEAGTKQADQARADILQKWTEESKALFGPAYPREMAKALAAAERFGGEELRNLLDATGLGSHPIVVKTFHQISQQISEDVSVAGKGRNTTDKTFTEALYGKAS